jgi:spermidine synthase
MIFEEIAFHQTPLGELSLRKRTDLRAGGQLVHEVILGDEFLMSSLFTAGECALADLTLAQLSRPQLELVVGGLGLGYTAATALRDPRTAALIVIDVLGPVIEWHRKGQVPLGHELADDERCRLVCEDFFKLAADPALGFDPERPGRRFDAVLLDIDHSTEHWLAPGNRALYSIAGLRLLAAQLRDDGAFGLWSNDPPVDAFTDSLRAVFADVDANVVSFPNPYTSQSSTCTVYVARGPLARP